MVWNIVDDEDGINGMVLSTNVGWFDRFSLGHASAGFLAAASGIGVIPTTLYSLVFELLENHVLKPSPMFIRWFPNSRPDRVINSLGDTISLALGWLMGVSAIPNGERLIGRWIPGKLLLEPNMDVPIDRYTLLNVVTGMWVGSFGWPIVSALWFNMVYEIIASIVVKKLPSLPRFIGGTLAATAGWSINLKDVGRKYLWD